MAMSQIEMDTYTSARRFFQTQVEKTTSSEAVKSQRRYEIAKECLAQLTTAVSAQVVQIARSGNDAPSVREQIYDSAAEVSLNMADALLKKLK
jgi:hypothetical protein